MSSQSEVLLFFFGEIRISLNTISGVIYVPKICLAVMIQLRGVTNRRTYRRTRDYAYALHMRCV